MVTGKTIYRDMTRFWGKLFGINFALGVATGLTMEFQFGTNWSFYSNYVGDIFGAPLAMEALMAFFLESTFVGLFFFGWQRLNKYQHLLVTAGGIRFKYLRIVDLECQWLDAVPDRGAFRYQYPAYGDDQLQRSGL